MLRSFLCFSLFTFLALSCETELTEQEMCEASSTCEVSDKEGVLTFNCNPEMKWEDMSDDMNFDCISCDKGMKWANNDHADQTCVPICKYPEPFNKFGFVNDCADGNEATICEDGDAPPPYAWSEALSGDGSKQSFSLEEWYCDEESDDLALIIVVVATWCGYCPGYVQTVGENAEAIKNAGGKIIFVVEDPESNEHARSYINGYIGPDPAGLRVSDELTLWQYDDGEKVETQGGKMMSSPAISGIPTAFVIKKDSLKVIESQSAAPSTLNFPQILEDIEAGLYDDPL